MGCIVVLTDLTSFETLACIRVPLELSLIPYTTILYLRSAVTVGLGVRTGLLLLACKMLAYDGVAASCMAAS